MIKRILVALDADEDTPVATNYAIRLGIINKARLTGLAVVDTSQMAVDIAMAGVEAVTYTSDLQMKMMHDAQAVAGRLAARFKVEARGSSLEAEDRIIEGVPYKEVIDEMNYHDLLVIGNESHFFYNRPQMDTGTLDQVVKRGVCPVLVVGKEYREIKKIMFAYDGSAPSARAIQRFLQLKPYGRQLSVEIVNIRPSDSPYDKKISGRMVDRMFEYIRAYGFRKVVEISRTHPNPPEGITEILESNEADMVVMGAHSVSAIRRLTFGSTTHYMVKNSPIPLFLSN